MSGPIVVPGDDGAASQFPTLADIYVPVAKQLGQYSHSSVSSTTTPSGEPGRWVILDEMRDDEYARAMFANGWLYVKTGSQAGNQRRIRSEGYEGPYGALALTRVLPSNLESNVFVEVTTPLPVRTVGLHHGLIECINQGLGQLMVEVRLPFTGNGTHIFSLSAYPWLTSDTMVDGIYDWTCGLTSTIYPPVRSVYEPTITQDGATLTLETGYLYASGSQSFQLKAYVPANRLTYDGSAWGYAQDGLVNDTDQAAVPLSWIRPLAMVKCLEHLLTLTEQDGSLDDGTLKRRLNTYTRQYQKWLPAANRVLRTTLPRLKSVRATTVRRGVLEGALWTTSP